MNLAAFDALTLRLIDHARLLGEAAAQRLRDPVRSWRNPRLIWPLFSKE